MSTSSVVIEHSCRLCFPFLVARGELAKSLEQDAPELSTHGRQVIRHRRRCEIESTGDVRVCRSLSNIVNQVVTREHVEHYRPASCVGMTLQINDRSLDEGTC